MEFVGNIDSYRITGSKLGKGGGGKVYLCEDSNGNVLALKIFARIKEPYDENLARFKNEIDFSINSNHPNVLKAIDQGETSYESYDRLPFYIMSKAKCNLRKFSKDMDLRNNPNEFKRILFEVIEGLIYIHDKGKIHRDEEDNYHRDIKPENILIMEDNNRAVVADFGIAHLREEFQVEEVETDPKRRPKNWNYYSPEIISGKPVDKRCDIFSLGYVIHELLTGELPRGTGQRICDRNPNFGALFDIIKDKMIKQDPADRYESFQDVKRDLKFYFEKNLKELEIPTDKMSNDEKTLFLTLLELDEDIANHFIGAISTSRNTSLPVRFSQSSHSINFICNFLHQLKKDFFKNVDILTEKSEELKEKLWEQLSSLCSFFYNISNGEKTNEREFEEKFREFQIIISEILKSNIDILKELDKLLEKEIPNQEDIEVLFQLLSKPSHSQYFFTRLSSPNWFDLLLKNNIFVEPRTKTIEGSLMISIWPQVNYLIKISVERAKDVFSVIQTLSDSKNYKIYWPLIECLFNMPVEVSQKGIPIIKKWTSYYISIPILAKIKELISKYLTEGEIDKTYEILTIILSVDEPEIKTESRNLYSKFHFIFSKHEDIREKLKNIDLTTGTNKYLQNLCNCLSNYLEKEIHVEGVNFNDYSTIWRSNIETKSSHDIKNLLVNEIIDYFKYIAANDFESVKTRYRILSNYKWVIFKRIQLYLLNSYSDIFTNEIEAYLTNLEIFEGDEYWVEYSELLGKNFSLISGDAQEHILNWIREGPDYSKIGITLELFTDNDEYQAYKNRFRLNWLEKRAKPIKYTLPLDIRKIYDSITSANRELRLPKKEKLSTEEIKNLSIEELIDYVNKYPKERNLSYLLRNLISENPSKYVDLLVNYKKIPFFYLDHIVEGFTRAIGGEKEFNIVKCTLVIIQISKEFIVDEKLANIFSFWHVIISFIRECLLLRNIELKEDLLNDIWDIICSFLTIKEPRIEAQESHYQNYVQFSINTYTGSVIMLIITYALYRMSISNFPPQNRMVPEVKEKLEELLDPKHDSAKIIWSIIAYNLYNIFYLNEGWASSKIPVLFSKEEQDLWLIAWESYISYNQLNSNIYSQLRNDYIIAIKKLESSMFSNKSLEGLSYHMVLAYVHELEDLGENSIVSLFLAKASSRMRSKSMWFTLKIYEEYKDTNEKERVLKRILNLWECEIENIKPRQDLTTNKIYDEIHWYGMLFQKLEPQQKYLRLLNEVLDLTEGNLGNTTNFIFDLLKKYIEINPKNILNVVAKLLKGEVSSWLFQNNVNDIIGIIKLVNERYDIQDFKSEVKIIGELLTDKGYHEIYDLEFIKNFINYFD